MLLSLLFLAACMSPDYKRAAEEEYLRHEIELEEAYENGYNDAADEYVFKIEDLQSVIGNAEEMADRLCSMLDAADDFTREEVYAAAEELRMYLLDNY